MKEAGGYLDFVFMICDTVPQQIHGELKRNHDCSWRSSMAEQRFCKPQVGGSIPLASSSVFKRFHRKLAFFPLTVGGMVADSCGFPLRSSIEPIDGLPIGSGDPLLGISDCTIEPSEGW